MDTLEENCDEEDFFDSLPGSDDGCNPTFDVENIAMSTVQGCELRGARPGPFGPAIP
jgi:hypothetical protein